MIFNRQLIKQLQEGKIGIYYDGKNLEDLRAVIKEAFPKHYAIPMGESFIYGANQSDKRYYCINNTYSSHYPVSDFIITEMPKYFAIKWTNSPLWSKYIDWLNETYGLVDKLIGNRKELYYGYGGETNERAMCHAGLYYFANRVIELTLEEWAKLTNMKEEKKEIIGYKIKKEFYNAVRQMTGMNTEILETLGNLRTHFLLNSLVYTNLKTLKVLDIWCEPVYKEAKKLPIINGYEGEKLTENEVKYGCVNFNLSFFKDILKLNQYISNRTVSSVKLSSNVEITFEQCKQIIEYFENQ